MWNKKSILWELEYWPMLDVRHSIDNMHVKTNVCEATCGTLLQQKSKWKDHKNAREGLKELGIRPEPYAEKQRRGRTLPLLQPPYQRREKRILSVFAWFETTYGLLIKHKEASCDNPPEITPYYRLNHSIWSLSDSKEVSHWVLPGLHPVNHLTS
jgi:hypothetical protein